MAAISHGVVSFCARSLSIELHADRIGKLANMNRALISSNSITALPTKTQIKASRSYGRCHCL